MKNLLIISVFFLENPGQKSSRVYGRIEERGTGSFPDRRASLLTVSYLL